MSATGAVVAFLLLWWLYFFMALPFGAAPDEDPVPGAPESAPAKPRLWLKAAIATGLALATTAALHYALGSGLLAIDLERPN